jgi:hypothetical protein
VIEPGERIWVGVDVGGRRALSSVVGVTDDLRVGVKSWRGEESVLFAQAEVERLAQEFVVVECAFDPWHFGPAALDLGQRGITMVEYPQRNERMAPASARLHAAVSEGRLRHPGDEHLDKAAATAVAKLLPLGWRIDRADKGGRGEIDPLIALGMCVDRAEQRPAGVELLGWLSGPAWGAEGSSRDGPTAVAVNRGVIFPGAYAAGKVRSCDAVSWLLSGTDARNVDAQACGSKSIIAITTPATTLPRT